MQMEMMAGKRLFPACCVGKRELDGSWELHQQVFLSWLRFGVTGVLVSSLAQLALRLTFTSV